MTFFPPGLWLWFGRHEVCLEYFLQTKANIGGYMYVALNIARLHDWFDFIISVQLQSTSLFWYTCSSRSFFFYSCESLGWILTWQNIEGKSGYCPYYMYKVALDMTYNQEVSNECETSWYWHWFVDQNQMIPKFLYAVKRSWLLYFSDLKVCEMARLRDAN